MPRGQPRNLAQIISILQQSLVLVNYSTLLTVKTLTGMTTDVYPRENCIAPAIVLIVDHGHKEWT
jgi:hypothetical protein